MFLRIVTFPYDPHAVITEHPDGWEIRGLLGDILRALSGSMAFNYSISYTPERTLGIRFPNGSWTGLIGSLQRNEADFALGLMIPTNARNAIAYPTNEVYLDEITILAGRAYTESTNIFGYVLTFDWQVWACVVAAMTTLSMLSAGFDLFYVPGYRRCCAAVGRFLQNLWKFFENLLGKGSPADPGRNASRVLSGFWWIAVTVLGFAFAGQMRACLMVKSQEAMLRGMDGLAAQSHLKPYTISGSILGGILKGSANPSYQTVYQRIQKTKSQIALHHIYSPEILREVLREKAVIIADKGTFTYKVARSCRNFTRGEFYIATEPIIRFRFVMYLSATMAPDLRRGINKRLVWLREAGIMDKWVQNMLGDWDHCKQESQKQTLSFSDLYAIFVMWALFIALSFAAFSTEQVVHKMMSRRLFKNERVIGQDAKR